MKKFAFAFLIVAFVFAGFASQAVAQRRVVSRTVVITPVQPSYYNNGYNPFPGYNQVSVAYGSPYLNQPYMMFQNGQQCQIVLQLGDLILVNSSGPCFIKRWTGTAFGMIPLTPCQQNYGGYGGNQYQQVYQQPQYNNSYGQQRVVINRQENRHDDHGGKKRYKQWDSNNNCYRYFWK